MYTEKAFFTQEYIYWVYTNERKVLYKVNYVQRITQIGTGSPIWPRETQWEQNLVGVEGTEYWKHLVELVG